MTELDCRGDMVARERRGLLSATERASIEGHVAACASCRLSRQLGADFDPIGAVRAGDEARVARVASALADRATNLGGAQRRRTIAGRALLLVATFALLATAAAGAYRYLQQPRPSEPPSTPAAATHARPPTVAAPLAAPSSAPADPPGEPAPATAERDAPAASVNRVAGETVSPSAAALLARANEARRRNEVSQAIALYRELEQRYPGSPEGQVARVSLGRLLLERGSAREALQQFDHYLAAGGSLAAEALYGRAKALGQLGRQSEERDAWATLLRQHPQSVYAPTAKDRLGALP